MESQAKREFGKRRPVAIPPAPTKPVKRSGHVALLVMGTLAIGGSAYGLMPRENCEPAGAGMAGPALPQTGTACAPRGSSSGGGHGGSGGSSSRSSFLGGDASSSRSSAGTSTESGSGQVTRGGFGGFARAFAAHFSGG